MATNTLQNTFLINQEIPDESINTWLFNKEICKMDMSQSLLRTLITLIILL